MDPDPLTEKQVQLLVESANRTVLNVLGDAGGSLHVDELADRLVSDDVSVVDSSTYEDRLERSLISLHHDRLPKLAEAGLIGYDSETNVATYRRAGEVEGVREGAAVDSLVDHLRSSRETRGDRVEVLTDREPIIQCGRQLADEAEEELFCMYVSPDLLEDSCIAHAERALERDVRMYLGSRNAAVRDLARTRLPDATVWEPQLDVLNTPSYPRVGRLVLIDRRKVMFAVLDEPDDDGTHPEETALVGEGEDHPLVVLVRELLGPRIDHLDYQSDDFRSKLPS